VYVGSRQAHNVVRFIYNIVFLLGFALSAPFYFLKMRRRGNWREGFGQRFANFDSKFKQAITNRDTIWLHAVSVGEVNICTQLIRALEPRVPKLKIIVSTTTSTGMAELKSKLPAHITKIYYPLDRRKYVRRALRLINPQAVVLIEAEIWPNFLWRCRDLGIPVFLVNARLSERSFRGYKRYGMLFRSVFHSFAGVGCQNDSDAKRLADIGCRPERIHVVGNLKFDAATLPEGKLNVPAMLAQIGVTMDSPIIVAGSTHDGEEKILGEVFVRLREKIPDLFLIVVPRHFERGREAARDLEESGLKVIYRSALTASVQYTRNEVDVLLVNTTGELRYFYEVATVVFVGKSLTAEGGQNPIEPGAMAKPIVFGSNMQNFQAITCMLLDRDGAWQVRDKAELEGAFLELLTDRKRASELGRNAQVVVKENLGSIERTVDMVLARLPNAK
jgi:3-deoxy-D-manno-octulosonic-acid transferase